ncbi:MAG: methionine adenosyltransferase [Mollicutes bacterium]|nr:methionine adenosyltransferase [Mollicutes bacterium]
MKIYSNEIVFRGHPDKVCDQISDAILDECLRQDENSRCGIEVMGGKGKIFITGEVTTSANIDVELITKRVLKSVGYSTNYEIIDNLGKQSLDIALGTNDSVGGAGDNGMMFGYATRDNEKFLPTAMVILQELSMEYDDLRKKDNRFLPDGKAQLTGIYENNQLKYIETLTICYQNTEEERKITDQILKDISGKIANKYNININNFLINPTGRFKIGGFEGDAGLTGRKIVVDTYQSFAKVGGGAFSGKDLTKVDRTGAYKAREIAKNILIDNNQLSWCEVQIAYAIGIEEPLSINIETDLGEIEPKKALYNDCKPKNIIKDLGLKNICYEDKAKFGHFID